MQLPDALLTSLLNVPHFDAAAFIETHNISQPPISIRLNPRKSLGLSIDWQHFINVPWCMSGKYLAERPLFTLDPRLHAGAYYVQEASSMFLERALETIKTKFNHPMSVLDVCAAPGGKSTHIAALLDEESLLVANEVIQPRTSILLENMTKWGNANVVVTQNDPKDFKASAHLYDVVLVDAPCSGSGLFRREPEAIKEWSAEAVKMCALRQQRILGDVIPVIQPGGYLIYATCSFSLHENECIIDWLAATFGVIPVPLPLQLNEGIVAVFSEKYNMPAYRFFPDKVAGEGFFLAIMQVPEGKAAFSKRTKKGTFSSIKWHNPQSLIGDFLHPKVDNAAYLLDNQMFIMPPQVAVFFEKNKSTLHIRKAGVKAGELIHQKFNPDHAFALSHLLAKENVNEVQLSIKDAISYLQRADFLMSPLALGWNLVSFEGYAIGWVKNVGNRVNNYYPKEWKIRMQAP